MAYCPERPTLYSTLYCDFIIVCWSLSLDELLVNYAPHRVSHLSSVLLSSSPSPFRSNWQKWSSAKWVFVILDQPACSPRLACFKTRSSLLSNFPRRSDHSSVTIISIHLNLPLTTCVLLMFEIFVAPWHLLLEIAVHSYLCTRILLLFANLITTTGRLI